MPARLVAMLPALVVAAAGVPQQPPAFRTAVDLVRVAATVTDRKGALATGLDADDFEILEDGRKQAIRYFASGQTIGDPAVPLHLGVLFDVSGSMEDDLGFTRTAAIRFLNTLPDAEDITVVDFDTQVRATRYGQNDFPRLVERIRQKKADGFTALYDAIGTYLEGASGRGGRTIMLLYTDGGDTRSALSRGELMDLLKASDVTVFAIGALEHQSGYTRNEQRMTLQQIAEITGGQAFFPTQVKELDRIYETVLAGIRAQYTLGYLSTNDRTDGTWRKVEIRVANRKDLHVRSRKGYFAPFRP